MKDFVKWLGVNEKIAKVVVWLLIIMVMLILTNAMLDSLGFSHYQITYNNLKQIDGNRIIKDTFSMIVCLLNFYCIVLIVFRINQSKAIIKYAIIYTVLNWIITQTVNYAVVQVFIILYILVFCYLYSQKKWKYVLYGIIAIFINMVVEGIAYLYKAHMIDFSKINEITRALLSIDYFIIMGIIILVKEIYLKKRSEKLCLGEDQEVYYGGANLKKKENSQRN